MKLMVYAILKNLVKSLPSRERGLKLMVYAILKNLVNVAPFAGAWIEINDNQRKRDCSGSRSLRGSVD